jgi:SAM-dependent methyltransferase
MRSDTVTAAAHSYPDSYFADRQGTDPQRLASFLQEKAFLLRHMDLTGIVCDVGCSTGEFLSAVEWSGPRFGMEVNAAAIRSAEKAGIRFDKSILTEAGFFDAVIFRGTIQHLPEPFTYIAKAFHALKSGGHVAFLATPNANSLTYKLFNTLPALEPERNFYVPSDVTLESVLRNQGFEMVDIEYPYLGSPYARPVRDHVSFMASLLLRRAPRQPFWRNMMNLIARKR